MALTTILRFDGERLVPEASVSDEREVLSADSFFLADGMAVAWKRHLTRFADGIVDATGTLPSGWDEFVAQSLAALPSAGHWFPRWDYSVIDSAPRLQLLVRPCPPRSSVATLAIAAADTRQVPWRKGPDLLRMGRLREDASALGANEALIVSDDDAIIEGAYSSVMVWRDESTVSITPRTYPRISSVTESVLTELLRASNITVIEHRHIVAELAGHEVWIVSALHGIREVERIIDGPPLAINRVRRDQFQEMWSKSATQIKD